MAAAPASSRGIGPNLHPNSDEAKSWSAKKQQEVLSDCSRMALTLGTPAGMFMKSDDGSVSHALRQACGTVRCLAGEPCASMGRSNRVGPDVDGLKLLHGFKMDGSNNNVYGILERDSGRARSLMADTLDSNLMAGADAALSMVHSVTGSAPVDGK